MDNVNLKYVSPGEMADMIGVKSRQLIRWAREKYIPKLVLPNGRFVFNPDAVIEALHVQGEQERAGK